MKNHVLLVDDDPNLLAGLRRALRKEPYEILSTTSGECAYGSLRILVAQLTSRDSAAAKKTRPQSGVTFGVLQRAAV